MVHFCGKTWLCCESSACQGDRVCGGQRAVGSSVGKGELRNFGCRAEEVRES